MARPACAISVSSPVVFSETVLPPVFGPVISEDEVLVVQVDVDRHDRQRVEQRVAAPG